MKQHIKIGKSVLILSVFAVIIAIFQISRMGLLKDTRESANEAYSAGTLLKEKESPQLRTKERRIGIAADNKDKNKAYLLEQTQQYLEHLGLEYTMIENFTEKSLADYELVIAFLKDFDDGETFYELTGYAQKGGQLYFPYLPVDDDSYLSSLRILGVVERSYEDFAAYEITDEKGIFGESGRSFAVPAGILGQAKVRLSSECETILSTQETPCFWEMDYGGGRIFAGSLEYLAGMQSRGIMAWVLYETLFKINGEAMISPYYGISTTILEDFPVTSYMIKSQLLDELKVGQDVFLQNYFYKLFLDIHKQWGDKLSMSFVVDTGEEFNEIFSRTLKRSQFMMYSGEILDTGGEITVGGYTNRPIGLDGELEEIGYFIPWKSRERMKEAFDICFDYVDEYYSGYRVVSYVLPQGRIGRQTLAEIGDVFPGLETVVNRAYIEYPDQLGGDFKDINGGKQYLYTIAGENGEALWGSVNSVLSLGIASNGFLCRELLYGDMTFEAFSNDVKDAYQWLSAYSLRKMTPREAVGALKEYQSAGIQYIQEGSRLKFETNHWADGMAFMLRTEQFPQSKDCTIEKAGNVYIVYPKKSSGTIMLEGGRS